MINDPVSTLPHCAKDPRAHLEGVQGEFFFFGGNVSEDAQLEVIAGGVKYCNEGYVADYQSNDYFSIEYVVSGKGGVELHQELFQLEPGSVFFHGPSIPCHLECSNTSGLKIYFVNFRVKDGFGPEWRGMFENNNPMFLSSHHWLTQALKQIVECGQASNKHASSACDGLLKYLLERVLAEGDRTPVILDLARESYEKTRSYIEENYLTLNRISEVSKACHMTSPHISRLFKRFSDQSPSGFLMSLKMEKAINMLMEGKYLIKEVASTTGFSDQYYFSTRFKQFYGESPTQFLENQQKLRPIG